MADIAQRLTDGALTSFERRRSANMDESGAELLLLARRAKPRREFAQALPRPLNGARAPDLWQLRQSCP
jgi:hypothetical protein